MVNKNSHDSEIKLRDYQIELFQKVCNQNAIIFLPTGSGKTCIALWLMRSLSKYLDKPVSEGGKRIVFLVNTQELVHQQAAYITKNSSFDVEILTGDIGVDFWHRELWQQMEDGCQVMVMTTQIYYNALTHSYLSLENCKLLIFDECHHAVSNHPMRQVMEMFDTIPDGKEHPKVLGLSATLLHANTNEGDFYLKIRDLKNTFRAEILTSKFHEEISKYATKPIEVIEHFPKFDVSSDLQENINKMQKNAERIVRTIKLKDDDLIITIEAQKADFLDLNAQLINIPGLNRTKILQNALKDILVHLKNFGPYVAYICCGLYIIQMYRFMLVSDEQAYRTVISYFINVTQIIRKLLFLEISKTGNSETVFTAINTSTAKLGYLCDVLSNMKPTDNCIIFVERKMTARSLYTIIKKFSSVEKTLSHVKVDFVVGTDVNPLRNTREGLFDQKRKKTAIGNFRKGVINVIVATNILEEGIDLQNCNYVVMFDELKTYRSYIQSKGRARMQTSQYIILNDIPISQFETRLRKFRVIESKLHVIIKERAIENETESDESPSSENADGYYITDKKAAIKPENSIPLIYRYCSALPHDVFTVLIPYWWRTDYCEDGDIYVKCQLQLPINAQISGIIESPKCRNFKRAKQAAAFEAVKMLHKAGGIDDHLLPIRYPSDLEDISIWLPNAEQRHDSTEDDNNFYSTYVRVPKFLKNCRPLANKTSFIHVIRTKSRYEMPDVSRKLYCHGLLTSGYEFGIISQNRLPDICMFPVYSDLGQVDVKIECNVSTIILNSKEIQEIAKFHTFLFLNVLKIVEKCFMFDLESKENDYFIVPLKPVSDDSREMTLAWNVITKKIETRTSQPTDVERGNTEYTEKNYLGKVITPWYHGTDKFCIVTEVDTGFNFQSVMQNTKETFGEYFKRKYNLTPFRPAQPIMEVRVISYLMECIKPRPIAASTKQKKRLKEDFRTFLPAEFCCKQIFPSVYWYKSILLPSILHRFYYLLLAEDLRQEIASKSGVGTSQQLKKNVDESKYFIEIVNTVPTKIKPTEIRKKLPKPRKSAEKKFAVASNLPKDIYHEVDVKLEDIEKYVAYVDAPLIQMKNSTTKNSTSKLDLYRSKLVRDVSIQFSEVPPLFTMKNYILTNGPNQYQILQALTLKGARDTINLERLETLGDSYLKYIVSYAIFKKEEKMNEGLLTQLKSNIIGNKYLLSCGKKLEVASYVNSAPFNTKSTWYPPGFTVPSKLKQFVSTDFPPAALSHIEIPYHEQFSGNISPETIEDIGEKLTKFINQVKDVKEKNDSLLFFINQKKLSNKAVADVIEALIGVYLETSGIEGAFNVMKYFGILTHLDFQNLMNTRIPSSASTKSLSVVESLFPDYVKLEKLLDYKFRDKAYLLQALTHPSCMTNTVTDCYQKLEFIGDAVLDFLITSYIYEYCGNLPPGGLTDLRSALVNNNTFGALAVRLNLHKSLLSHCKQLQDAINMFVDYQEEKNYEIHGNELMKLINENDIQIAEEVDVPKALGDIFESIAGAIFLDSGNDLKCVWRIYYNIMKDEIDKFSKCIPINPIRALYEMNFKKIQFLKENNKQEKKNENRLGNFQEGKQKLKLFVTTKREIKEFQSQGVNLAAAKRAAAKLALKEFGRNDFVI